MAQWQPPDYAVPVQKKWKPPPYVVSPPTQETRKPLEQELDEEYAKQAPPPEPEESGLGKIWRVANTPVGEYLPESLQGVRPNRLVSHVAEPLMKYGESAPVGKPGSVGGFVNELGRKAARYGGALAQSMGNVTDEMLNPINIGLTALTGGASMARGAAIRGAEEGASIASIHRLANLAKGLETPGRVAGGAMVAHGGYKMATGDTLEEKLGGGVEAVLGGLGVRAGRFPDRLKMRNIEEVAPPVEAGQRMLPLPRGNEPPVEPAGPFNLPAPVDMSNVERLRKYMDDLEAGKIPRDSPIPSPELPIREGEIVPSVEAAPESITPTEPVRPEIPKIRSEKGIDGVNRVWVNGEEWTDKWNGGLTDAELQGLQRRAQDPDSFIRLQQLKNQQVTTQPEGPEAALPPVRQIPEERPEAPDLVPGTPLAKYQEYRRTEREAGRKPVTYLQWENRIGTAAPEQGFDEPQFREVPEKPKQRELTYKTPEESFVQQGEKVPEETRPTATYNYFQPDEIAGGGFDQYDIQGGPYDRSTVGRDRLIEQGIDIPETPTSGKMIPARVRGFLESAGISPQEIDSYTAQQAIGKMGELRNSGDIRDESGRSIAPAQPVPEAIQERPAGPWDTNAPPDKWIPPEYAVPSDEPQFQAKEFGNENIFKGSKGEGLGKEPFDKQWETSIEEAKKLGIDYKSYDNLDELQWDITKKAAQETIRTGKNPIGKTEGPQFARSEKGGIKIGVNIKRAAKEVTTGYSAPLESIMIREGAQNLLDAVKHLGVKGTGTIKITEHGMEMSDNGKGMDRNELETVFSNLNESGKAGQEGATGGKGVGKASYILGGDRFFVSTVKTNPKTGEKTRLTANGTPDEFIEHVDINEENVSADTPTGTTIQTVFAEGQDPFSARQMLRKIVKYSRGLGTKLKIEATGVDEDTTISTGEKDQIIGKRTFTDEDGSVNDVTVRIPHDAKYSDRRHIDTYILNNGMYQYSDSQHLGLETPNMPGELIIDIHPHAEEGTKQYPFPTARESIKESLDKFIHEFVKNVLVDPQQQARKSVLKELYASMAEFPGATTYRKGVMFDTGDRLTPEELENFQTSPTLNETISFIDKTINDILTSIGDQKLIDRLEGVGLLLTKKPGMTTYGVHIPNPDTKKSTLLVNIFEHLADDDPVEAVFGAMVTLLHEVGHIGSDSLEFIPKLTGKQLEHPRIGKFLESFVGQTGSQGGIDVGHGIQFIKRMGDAYARYGPDKFWKAADELHRIITDDTGGYTPEIQELLSIYQESRGRPEVTKDFLSGTGNERKFGGRGKENIPSDDKPDGEGTPITGEKKSVAKEKPDRRKKAAGRNKTDAKDAVGRLKVALERGLLARKKQNLLYSAERSKRAAKISQVKTKGMAGHYERLGMLRGALPKVSLESGLKQEDLDTLADAIVDSDLKPYQKVSTVDSIADMFNGITPQDRQIDLIAQALGHDLGETIAKYGALGMIPPIKNIATETINVPKTLMATIDMSAPLAQGFPLVGTKEYWRAFSKMFDYYGKEKSFQALKDFNENRPHYQLGEESGLFLPDLDETDVKRREEAFLTTAINNARIPMVGIRPIRASNRAFIGFLNKTRADRFDFLIDKAKGAGRDIGHVDEDGDTVSSDLTEQIAKFVNNTTGRGGLGKYGERVAVPLNAFMFSPRLNAARLTLLNPKYYYDSDPFIRKEILKSLLSMAGFVVAANAMAWMAYKAGIGPEPELNIDPTNTDFSKLKYGKVREDFGGGFQQYLVLAMRLIMGKSTSITGKEYDLNEAKFPGPTRVDILTNFARSKESPVASFIDAMLSARQSFPPSGIGAKLGVNRPSAEVINRVTPMMLNDLYDLYQEDPSLLPLGLPVFFGARMQVIQPPAQRQPFRLGTQRISPPAAP